MTVTVFTDIKNTDKPSKSSVVNVLNQIKTGGKIKDQVLEIRELYKTDKAKYKQAKTGLPVILFNGQFNKRSKEGLINGSGLAVLDFDNVDSLSVLAQKLKNDPYIYSFFLSPSGNGYKALMRIPIVKSDEEFKEYFAAIEKRYPELDQSGKDISRAAFFSYDPDVYVNTKAITFQQKVVAERTEVKKKVTTDWKKMSIPLNKVAQSVEGEQHNVLLKMSNLAGEYVKQGKVDKEEAVRLLCQEFEKKNPEGHYDYEKTIRDGIENSLKNPMRKFEVEELERMDVGKGRCYFTLLDVREKFDEIYNVGYVKGAEIGWKVASKYISIKKGSTSYWYGKPFVGKSQILLEILVNLSKFYGWKHAILSPETGRPEEIYAELASMYIGKSFHGGYKMTEDEKSEAADFIERHFVVVDPSAQGLTITEMFDQVEGLEREFNVSVDTITIDPWNELSIDFSSFGGREDKYLEYILTKIRQFAQSKEKHIFVVNHVRDQSLKETNKGKPDSQQYYDTPTPRDLAGGQLWYRKGLLMVCVDRPVDIYGKPLLNENGEPYQENETHIYIQKAKPKGSSTIGKFSLYLDWKKNKYYEVLDDINMTKNYARNFWQENSTEVQGQNALVPNGDFDNVPF